MLLIGIAFLAFLLFLRWKKHLKKIYFLFILIYGFCWIHAEDQTKIPEIEQQLNSTDGTAVIVQGEVIRIVEKETYTQLTLTDCKASLRNTKTADKANDKADKADDKVDNGNKKSMSTESKHLTLLVNANQTDCVIGDIVKVTGKAKTFAQARNVGEFDGAVYYRSIGVNFKITANEVKRVSSSEHKLQQWLQSIRERIGKVYNEIAPEKEAGIYQSIVLGDKSSLDQEIRDLYQTSGIAHLLAISGVKTLCLVSPLSLESGLKWGFLRLHNAKKYIRNLCFKGQFLARCPSRFCGGKFQYNNLAKGYTFLRNYEQLSESK